MEHLEKLVQEETWAIEEGSQTNILSSSMQGSSNVTPKRKYSATMDTNSPQLFLILKDLKYEYCLYRISEPENNDESSIVNLGKPLLKMDRSTYPKNMSFVALGTRIYMVGGTYYPAGPDDYASSNKMFICDPASQDIVRGPNLVSGKIEPVLLTLGSKIYALSSRFFRFGGKCTYKEAKPGLQVLDTENLERGWSLLPAPPLRFRGEFMLSVDAYAAVDNDNHTCSSSAIFISLSNDAGTYAFDVDNKVWAHVSRVNLPFSDYAMPCAPSLYCADSMITGRFSAFRFCYNSNANNRKFRVDEIKIHNSSVLDRELPPCLHHETHFTGVGSSGRVYSITIGFDDAKASDDPKHVNRYVKVNATQVCQVDPKMKRHTRIEEKEKDENVTLKRCRTMEWIRNNEVEDGGELKMSERWTSSMFGGQMVNIYETMNSAAFAF